MAAASRRVVGAYGCAQARGGGSCVSCERCCVWHAVAPVWALTIFTDWRLTQAAQCGATCNVRILIRIYLFRGVARVQRTTDRRVHGVRRYTDTGYSSTYSVPKYRYNSTYMYMYM
eukprot:scaffold2703_cov129-Isochrysis_galbana.AAC.2